MKRILIIEDDEAIVSALEDDFVLEGYEVLIAMDGALGLELGLREKVDIIILDIMLPNIDGVEILKKLRKHNVETPIIMLSAKSQEIDRVLGLELGADDYVTKPFSPRELQARVKAILRRKNDQNEQQLKAQGFGNIKIDIDRMQVYKDGMEINLTTLEFDLLKYFLLNKYRVLTREQILKDVWEGEVMVELRTVDTHVSNLRKKIEDNPSDPEWIIGVRGVGYRFS